MEMVDGVIGQCFKPGLVLVFVHCSHGQFECQEKTFRLCHLIIWMTT